jgi:uncharacterized protein YkwD
MIRRLRALALVLVLGTVGLLVAPEQALAWDANSFSAAAESQLLTLINQARASHGLRAVKVDATLTSVARWRSRDMAVRGYFSHAIPKPPGGDVFNELDRRGYCYLLAGENIGWNNYPDDVATAQIMMMFMASTDHRASILRARWDRVGIGAYKAADGRKLYTVLFVDRCGSAPRPTSAPRSTSAPTRRAAPTPRPEPTARPSRRCSSHPVLSIRLLR